MQSLSSMTSFDDDGNINAGSLGIMDNTINVIPTINLTNALVGAVRVVTLTYTAFSVWINKQYFNVPAGGIALNSVDVLVPTTHYVYLMNVANVATMIVSTTDPHINPLITEDYTMFAMIRFTSIAGVYVLYYRARAFTQLDELLHNIGDFATDSPYTWVNGGGLSIDAVSGEIDMTALTYRKLKFPGTLAAITNGAILFEDETTTAANLELITTYSDGSAITAGKYHKLLIAVICSPDVDYRFIVVRQGKPAVEYATLEAARIDGEVQAATAMPDVYRPRTLILGYIVMKLSDASDIEVIDLRATGVLGGGGGGGGALTDHSTLVNLAADDHLQYHNDARALTWIGTRSSTDLPEGAKLFFTNERAQDAVGTILVDSNDINFTYDDAGNTISASFSSTGNANVALVNGANNNVNIGTALLVRVTGPAAPFSITGITGGYAGRQLFIYNTTASNMTVSNEDAGSLAANRIITLGSASTVGTGMISFIYSATDSRWLLMGIRA